MGELAPIGFLKKPNKAVCSFVRNTSCSRGWLRLLVQIIFGVLIVSSFILIVLMALGNSRNSPRPNPRCIIQQCRVVCNEVPFFGEHEDDIISAASEADANCETIALLLNRPTFINSKLPENWLSRMRANIRELAIVGGNIKHIPPHAFMSPFSANIRILILERIEIAAWENDMLVGLSNLKKLFIKDCTLVDLKQSALRAVDDTLEFLDIKATPFWDPTNITGTADLFRLNIVDFSSNAFHDILASHTFSRMQYCRVLFLNSCQITSIGPGTFDHLQRIEVLYLNDNYLTTIPTGLFDKIIPYKPRIALHDNYWHCDCTINDFKTILQKGLLIIDPVCHYPDVFKGLTFSEFQVDCNKNVISSTENTDSIMGATSCRNITETIYMNGACSSNVSKSNSQLEFVAPLQQHRCLSNRINNRDLVQIAREIENDLVPPVSDWLKPTFLVQMRPYSMVEIVSSEKPGQGLLWYQSSCMREVYCVNVVPNVLRVFNVDLGIRYTFCPFNVSTGAIHNSKCVSYNLADLEREIVYDSDYRALILYICISFGCLICGAICVYALIHKNPSLLKGSKRVLFVKHKSVEALILPPKVPLRSKSSIEKNALTRQVYEKRKIFVLPDSGKLCPENFVRSISMRSTESNDASYISALQPTDEQLCEWRSKQNVKEFDNTPTSDVETSTFSSLYDRDSLPYYSFQTSERIYEVPKQY